MKPEIFTHHHDSIVYDAQRITEMHAALMQARYWQDQQAVFGQAHGRGNTLFISAPFGDVALRQYRRGGWPSRFIKDRYLYTGLERSRSFREFHLLARLFSDGFPVPAPLAASCERQGVFYHASLMTELLSGVVTLAQYLAGQVQDDDVLRQVGSVIRAFHAGGVHHADLNANNVLIDAGNEKVYLVDFDRCSYRPGHRIDGRNNIERLKRSIRKCSGSDNESGVEKTWSAIMRGYRGEV